MKRKSALGLLIGCLAAVLVVAGCGGGKGPGTNGHSTTTTTNKPRYSAVGPVLLSPSALAAEASIIKQPIYWAGPLRGHTYEFTRTTTGSEFVRYLPKGAKVGVKGARYLIVATYPFHGAYEGLKKVAKKKAISGPGGSLLYVRPKDRRSVLMAFPKVSAQLEIYDPRPATALAVARSGHVRPVG